MAIKDLPTQISQSYLNDTRKELDDKLTDTRKELTDKIDQKLPATWFWSVIGLLVLIGGSIMSCLYIQINTLKDDKIEGMQSRLTVVETKFNGYTDVFQKHQESIQKQFAGIDKQLADIEKKIESRQETQSKNR